MTMFLQKEDLDVDFFFCDLASVSHDPPQLNQYVFSVRVSALHYEPFIDHVLDGQLLVCLFSLM